MKSEKKDRLREAVRKSSNAMFKSLPTVLGAILLVSIVGALIPRSWYASIFSGNYFIDPLVGSLAGSVLAGNPVTSYVLGGEMLNQGASLIAVTAFIIAWVTVGVVQLPAEAIILGKRFAVARNISSFFLSILVALLTVLILGVV